MYQILIKKRLHMSDYYFCARVQLIVITSSLKFRRFIYLELVYLKGRKAAVEKES